MEDVAAQGATAAARSLIAADDALPRIDFDAPTKMGGVVERRARLRVAAFHLPRLLEPEAARRVYALAAAQPFSEDPDTVDRRPTWECFIFDRGDALREAPCRAIEAPVRERLLPYLRQRFGCKSLELAQALVRRHALRRPRDSSGAALDESRRTP